MLHKYVNCYRTAINILKKSSTFISVDLIEKIPLNVTLEIHKLQYIKYDVIDLGGMVRLVNK